MQSIKPASVSPERRHRWERKLLLFGLIAAFTVIVANGLGSHLLGWWPGALTQIWVQFTLILSFLLLMSASTPTPAQQPLARSGRLGWIPWTYGALGLLSIGLALFSAGDGLSDSPDRAWWFAGLALLFLSLCATHAIVNIRARRRLAARDAEPSLT